MSMQNKLKGLIEVQTNLRKEFQSQAQAAFKEVVKEFFDTNTGINLVTWTQYTPYFNDGESCEFSVNEAYFSNVEDVNELSYGEYGGEDDSIWSVNNPIRHMRGDVSWDKETSAKVQATTGLNPDSIKEFMDILNSSEMEDIFSIMFGDHVRVTLTRAGIEVEEYDHD